MFFSSLTISYLRSLLCFAPFYPLEGDKNNNFVVVFPLRLHLGHKLRSLYFFALCFRCPFPLELGPLCVFPQRGNNNNLVVVPLWGRQRAKLYPLGSFFIPSGDTPFGQPEGKVVAPLVQQQQSCCTVYCFCCFLCFAP